MTPREFIPSPKYSTVELIPWDSSSEAHFQRLYEQRVACTWDMNLIEEWKARVLEGKKFMYWIVRPRGLISFNPSSHWLICIP
jgi:hypothetical protein